MLYQSGGRGMTRYFFLHGNHGGAPLPETLIIEARVVVFDSQGSVLFGTTSENSPQHYRFTNGSCTHVDDQEDAFIPARRLTETLLKNLSVPTLVLGEIPTAQSDIYSPDPYLYVSISVLGRCDLRPASVDDINYLETMTRVFVPRLVRSMSCESASYLPGNVQDLCKEVAADMEATDNVQELNRFLELYRQRYIRKPVEYKGQVLETCLLYMLKMPFDITSSTEYRLIRY